MLDQTDVTPDTHEHQTSFIHEQQRSSTSTVTSQIGDVIYVKLEKRDRGLGFSILDSLVCKLFLFLRNCSQDYLLLNKLKFQSIQILKIFILVKYGEGTTSENSY